MKDEHIRGSEVKKKTKLVCGKCGADWKDAGSPAVCPICHEDSFLIAVLDNAN